MVGAPLRFGKVPKSMAHLLNKILVWKLGTNGQQWEKRCHHIEGEKYKTASKTSRRIFPL